MRNSKRAVLKDKLLPTTSDKLPCASTRALQAAPDKAASTANSLCTSWDEILKTEMCSPASCSEGPSRSVDFSSVSPFNVNCNKVNFVGSASPHVSALHLEQSRLQQKKIPCDDLTTLVAKAPSLDFSKASPSTKSHIHQAVAPICSKQSQESGTRKDELKTNFTRKQMVFPEADCTKSSPASVQSGLNFEDQLGSRDKSSNTVASHRTFSSTLMKLKSELEKPLFGQDSPVKRELMSCYIDLQ